MLSFFPNPYPDELIYSVLARYHIRSGNISPKITMRELFGKVSSTAIVDLPSNLGELVTRLGNFSNYSFLNFVNDNTLYPFYAPFIPEKRATLILKAMKSKNGGSINAQAGIMASSIKNPKYLGFCPMCFDEDILTYGEAYWHRLHQIPGVIFCVKHKLPILNSLAHWHEMNKHEYVAAERGNCIVYPYDFNFTSTELEKLLKLCEEVTWLVRQRLKSHNIEWFYERYKAILINKGYATPKGRVHQKELIQDFQQFYEDMVLQLMQAEICIEHRENWLSSIVRKPRKVFYPIKHLLLINFLGMSTEEFFYEKQAYNPFGIGPWPCLNKASTHYHEDIIDEVIITYDNKIKVPVGNFSCECGFIYSRRGPDTSEKDRYKIGRIKEFGSIWKDKLKELSSNKSLSLREIARRLNVDTKTVIKYLKAPADSINGNKEADIKFSKEEYRKKWIKYIKDNNDKSVTQLRELNNALFQWLYKKDHKWLKENSPKQNKRINTFGRIDWEKRDIELLKKAKRIVNSLMIKEQKPERITISRIGKLITVNSILEKHSDKVPMTIEYLKNVVEDLETYQIRRVKWAARELLANGEPLKAWSIKRKAGLRTNCCKKVERAIEDEIDFYMENRKEDKVYE